MCKQRLIKTMKIDSHKGIACLKNSKRRLQWIGSAKVDTILDEMSVYQGATLRGHVQIKGGDVEQQIDAITIKLNTEMKVEVDDSISYQTFTIDQLKAVEPFVIQPNEEKQVPFELKLHDETPITAVSAQKNQCHVWVETTLDIGFAIDPRDRDYIEVKPLPVASRVIQAIEQAGFTMVKADVEKGFLRGNTFSSSRARVSIKNWNFVITVLCQLKRSNSHLS